MGWEQHAECSKSGLPIDEWFPERTAGRSNHGQPARAVCATCPVVRDCLEGALDRNEEHGIWGGAGESMRRWLARAYKTGGTTWTDAMATHLRDLAGQSAGIVDRNGPQATHGLRSTYNRGCRCKPCRLAASDDVAGQKNRRTA